MLIVDDDDEIRESLETILGQEGYSVRSAPNGRVALEILARIDRPHAILLDLMMPVMDGYAFAEAIDADPRHRGVPIIVLTASTARSVAGTRRLLRKPVAIDDVLAALDEVTSRAPAERPAQARDRTSCAV